MIIDKFNNKTAFNIKQIRDKIVELQSSPHNDERRLYEYKKFIKNLTKGEREYIEFHMTSAVINKNDIENLFYRILKRMSEIDLELNEIMYYNNKLATIEQSVLISLLIKVKNLINKLKTNVIGNHDIVDDFKDSKFIDSNFVNTQNGFLSLKSTETVDMSSSGYVEVVDSNGLPGDTHTAFVYNGAIRFNGESNTKLNVQNVISKDGVFEYEIITIPVEEYKKTKGYGFSYDEGVPFISDEEKLYVKMIITFKRTTKVNTIRFKDCQNSSPYVIKKLKIKAKNGNIRTIANNVASSNHNVFSFKTAVISSIELELEQNVKDKCYIGHFYNSEIRQSEYGYDEEYKEIKIGSINTLGVTVDPTTKQLKHPKSNTMYTSFDESATKERLFNNNLARELVPCERASISIGSLMGFYELFSKEGFCISEYSTPNAIKSITLEANEFLPNTEKDTFIRYYISFDKENWHAITPLHRTDKDNYHTINVNSIITTVPINTKSIYTSKKEYKFYLKIELSTSSLEYTPVVNQVSFKIREWED